MFKPSQETTAIVTVDLTILGSSLCATNILQDRIDRVENGIRTLRAEGRADRIAPLRAERPHRPDWRTETPNAG